MSKRTIKIDSKKYSGSTANIVFIPANGNPPISLGLQNIPYYWVTDYYYGSFSLSDPLNPSVTCVDVITPPPATPTPTPSPTKFTPSTPTPTPTPSVTGPTPSPSPTGPTPTPTQFPTPTPTPTSACFCFDINFGFDGTPGGPTGCTFQYNSCGGTLIQLNIDYSVYYPTQKLCIKDGSINTDCRYYGFINGPCTSDNDCYIPTPTPVPNICNCHEIKVTGSSLNGCYVIYDECNNRTRYYDIDGEMTLVSCIIPGTIVSGNCVSMVVNVGSSCVIGDICSSNTPTPTPSPSPTSFIFTPPPTPSPTPFTDLCAVIYITTSTPTPTPTLNDICIQFTLPPTTPTPTPSPTPSVTLTPGPTLISDRIPCYSGMDVVFVVDITSSMGTKLDSIKSSISNITNTIVSLSNNNYRLGLVLFDERISTTNYNSITYQNLPSSQKYVKPTVEYYGQNRWQYFTALELMNTNNQTSFISNVNLINTEFIGSGAYPPEPCVEAVELVGTSNVTGYNYFAGTFRNNVAKIIILITDADPGGDDEVYTAIDITQINNLIPQLLTQKIRVIYTTDFSGFYPTALIDLAVGTNGYVASSFDSSNLINAIVNNCNGIPYIPPPLPTPNPTPFIIIDPQPASCSSCFSYPLRYNYTGYPYGNNITLTTTYNQSNILESAGQLIYNCTNAYGTQNPTVFLGGQSNNNYIYSIKFNQPVNNVKFVITDGGDTTARNAYDNHIFNTNVGVPTLTLCGPSCNSRVNGNVFESKYGGGQDGGSAFVQVSSPTPYTEIIITGGNGIAPNGIFVSICFSQIPLPPPTPLPT